MTEEKSRGIPITLYNGIDKDVRPRHQTPGTYRDAMAKQASTDTDYSGGLTNELRTIALLKIPGTVVGYHRLEERNATLFYHIDGGSAISIFHHDTHTVTPVAKDTDFGCTWGFNKCRWIGYGQSVSKTLAPCNDLMLYWASDDYYYKANLDELLSSKRKAAISALEDKCDYFKLFKCISGPIINVKPLRDGGWDLSPGQYYVVARFKDESGNASNWSTIYGPAYIGSKYNRPGDISKQSIRIEVNKLSKHYSRVEVAVIPPIGSQNQDIAYVIYDGSFNTNGVTVDYRSASQHLSVIPMGQILKRDIKWLRGAKMFQDEGTLSLYQTRQEFNPPVQKWANQTQVTILAYAVPADKAHLFTGLRHDEVYALGQHYNYCDQTRTVDAHIVGRTGGSNELSCGCDMPPGHSGNNASLLRTYVTMSGSGEDWCFKPGTHTTINENNLPGACGSAEVTPRASEQSECAENATDRIAVQAKADAITSTTADAEACLTCAQGTTGPDLITTEGGFINMLEQFKDMFRTETEIQNDCSTGKYTTLKDAAKAIYDEAILNAEKDEEIQYATTVTATGGTNINSVTPGDENNGIVGSTTQAPPVTAIEGNECSTEEVEPILLSEWTPAGWESELLYSNTKDCDGNFHYEHHGQRLRFIKTPSVTQIPLTITAQRGVESRFDPTNTVGKDTYVVMLGLKVSNVYIPSFDAGEIPKPLDENIPWSITMVKREAHNCSTVASGYLTHTFRGKRGGKVFAVPKSGGNAYVDVDVSIDDNGSRKGEHWDEPLYLFHSPEVGFAEIVSGDYLIIDGKLSGSGLVYGLYDEGADVPEEKMRLDRRGMRSALNLNVFTPGRFSTCITGIEHAEHNTNVQNPAGIKYPLLGKYRESTWYLQTEQPLPALSNNNKDHSITGGGLIHEYPTEGEVWYGTIRRFNRQQYGAVESLQYIDINLHGRKGASSAQKLTGDTFLQKWSDKRTAFLSDKVGNFLNEDFPITASDQYLGPVGARKRGVCDPPNRRGMRMKEFLGMFNAQALPASGDEKDPKNMANMHPTLTPDQILSKFSADTDVFYPRTSTHLNHLFVETGVNLHFRSTNLPETRDVFYEQLQGLDLDSSINAADPEECWLNDYHNQQKQPSKKQANRKAQIRTFLVLVLPVIILGGAIIGIATALQGSITMTAVPAMFVIWKMLVYNVYTNKKLDRILGIPICKIDSEGAQNEKNIRGLRDNHYDYNWGFSDVNDNNVYVGMPYVYNTCKCTSYSNLIYKSNQQIHTSPYDAYANFQALSYTGIRGDAGALQLIVAYGNQIAALTTDGAFLLQHKNVGIPSNGGMQYLGSSGWMENPPRILDGVFEGHGGTEDPNAVIICKYGAFIPEYEGRLINHWNGGLATPINGKKSGLYHYMQDHLPFCTLSGCRDVPTPGNSHYALGYDPERELLLITKPGEWTWSYDILSQKFVSRHHYQPDFYFWDRHKLYSVKDGEISIHNTGNEYYPSFVEGVATTGETITFENLSIDSEVNVKNGNDFVYDRAETYDYITARTEFTSSGRLPLVQETPGNLPLSTERRPEVPVSRRQDLNWSLIRLRSNENDRDAPIVKTDPCGGTERVDEANIDAEQQIASKSKTIKGKFISILLEHEGGDEQIILHKMILNAEIDKT